MKILIYTLFPLMGWISMCHGQALELERADSLILLSEGDSALNILQTLDSTDRSDITFRVELLEAIFAETNDEETVQNIEGIREKYRNSEFSALIKVAYLSYFSELMGPDPNWREYNLNFLDEIITIYEEGGEQDSFMLMHMLHNKGNILYHLIRNYEAIPFLEQALEIARTIDTRDSSLLGIILFNLANPVYKVGQYKRSNELLVETDQYFSSLKNPNPDYYQTLQLDLFAKALSEGDLQKAENYLNKAIDLYERNKEGVWSELNSHRKDMALKYNAMRLYAAKEDFVNAELNLKDAQRKFGSFDSNYFRLRLAAIYELMGDMYLKKQATKSFVNYQKAIDIYDNPDDPNFGLRWQYNLGKAYLKTKQYDQVVAIMTPVIEKAEAANNHEIPYFYSLDAKRWIEQGKLTEGLTALNKLANSINKGEKLIDLLAQEGLEEFKNGNDLDKAYVLSEVAQWIERYVEPSRESNLVMNSLWRLAISNFQSSYRQIQFSEVVQRQYEIMMHGLLKTDNYLDQKSLAYEEIIKLSENSTSRGLWEQFKLKYRGDDLVDHDLLAEEQKLRSEITSLKKRADDPDSLAVKKDIFEIELALEKLNVEKRKKNNSFYKYEDFSFDFSAFQNNLGFEDQVLKYEYLDSILYVYDISHDNITIKALDSLTRIDNKVLEFTKLLKAPSSSTEKINLIGKELGDLLLPEDLKPNIRIVGDGVLNYLPFDLLSRNGKYLIESHIVSNATSLALLDFDLANHQIKNTLLIAPSYDRYTLSSQQLAVRGEAYNLEGALKEAERISEIIPAEKLTKNQALKQTFIDQAPAFDLIHLSMHSYMNDEDPELSSLVFHDGEIENELYISELYGMNLNAKLAVLSACNTGVGKEKTGEGMVSVNRAFTYAGVPSVVSSLWSAPDQATTELMTEFYKEMKSGKTKSESLRNAKLTYLQNVETKQLKHPYFWAGFVLHGDQKALTFKNTGFSTMIWLVIGLCLALILFVFSLRRLKNQ